MILNIEKGDLFDSASNMAPSSEENTRSEGQFNLLDEIINKEKQRPPIYNPEDYALMLKKWGKKSSNGGLMSLYSTSSTSDLESSRSQTNSFRDYRNPMLTSSGSEMTLRQFGTVSELLTKLKTDMRLAFPSFVQEFASDPLDGVSLLLDLLRAIKLSQSNTVIHGPPGSSGTTGKLPPSLQRRALLDELSCLQCLLNCCIRYTESLRKLISSSAGLFTVAVCIMSNVNKSRIIALQLLAKACDPSIGGHSSVSEAISTLRLRFGEPVRFRFLVGMMMSTGGQKELLSAGLRFLNKFMDTAGSSQKRLYIQAELDQAGLDISVIKKNISNSAGFENLLDEIQYWEKKNINIENLTYVLSNFKKENAALREKVGLLERKMQSLQDEKGALTCVERTLKERCNELKSEIRSLKSSRSSKGSYTKKRNDSTPNEDEGISSSERSLTPEEELQRGSLFETYGSPTNQLSKPVAELTDIDDETTIDEVIAELRNIINDAESEDIAKKEQRKLENEKRRLEEAQVASKLKIHIDADDYAINSDNEIIPAELHPLPPRRAKSLVHLFVPSEDYYYCPKELFFENETPYTSTEGSDSLLSASKCGDQRVSTPETLAMGSSLCKKMSDVKSRSSDKRTKRHVTSRSGSIKRSESFRQLNKPFENGIVGSCYYSTTVNVCQKQMNLETYDSRVSNHAKSKSLDRIDNGLDSMVDIVVTNQSFDFNGHGKPKSDSAGNTSLVKSVSNVYIKNNMRPKFGSYCEEKSIMFLPSPSNALVDTSCYFPRIQEKKTINPGFLIKRGHGNAGMYSGQLQGEGKSGSFRNKEFLTHSNGSLGGKLTDLPSGLY
uniref:GBD/FH3 domain-containing protein n=1 Tax=Dendroctonus ponderosae TaxID=77166 RepID=A0AAR5PJC6_DENPD